MPRVRRICPARLSACAGHSICNLRQADLDFLVLSQPLSQLLITALVAALVATLVATLVAALVAAPAEPTSSSAARILRPLPSRP